MYISRISRISRLILGAVLFATTMMTALGAPGSAAAAGASWRTGAGGAGDPPALGYNPAGIAIDPANPYLFVANSDNGVVKIYDLDGGVTAMTLAPSPDVFLETMDVQFDGNGHVYVTDRKALYRFDVNYSSGAYVFDNMIKWDGSGLMLSDAINSLLYPQGIAAYGNALYVADTNHDRVLKFDASTFSPTSVPVVMSGDLDPDPAKDATLNSPLGIAADSSGVYIANNNASNIIKIKPDGSTLSQSVGSRPRGISLNADGNLYVALFDSVGGSLVSRFDANLNKNAAYFLGNSNGFSTYDVAFDNTGALYLSSYAQAVPYDGVYDALWKQTLPSPDNRLSGLTASGVALSYDAAAQTYTASVGSNVLATSITPTLADAGASVTVKGGGVLSGNASSPISLTKGVNTIPVIVTAANDAKRTYTVKIDRAASTDATLSGLSVNTGSLNIPFDSATTAYATNVANGVTAISVTPTANDSRAAIQVNGAPATSGVPFLVSSLAVGATAITVSVTAEDGTTTQDYILTVTRAPSSDAALSALTVSAGSLDPVFAPGTTSYTVSVANGVDEISVTPTVASAGATVTVGGLSTASGSARGPIRLSVGPNAIPIIVTAQDGMTTTLYTITVNRAPSTDAALSGLTIDAGILDPTFAPGTTTYTAAVANGVDEISVTPTAASGTATLTVNGHLTVSGSVYGPIPLAVGPNTISVNVTAQDGVTTTPYTLTVTRAPSADATLSGLAIDTGALNPAFAPGTTTYTAAVANGIGSVRVTPTSANSGASITVNGIPATSGGASAAIPLAVGENTITVAVTAQDRIATKEYTVILSRARASSTSPGPSYRPPSIDLGGGESITVDRIDTTKPSVVLNVTPKDGVAVVRIPSSILAGLADKNASFLIEIRTPYGSYRIPVQLASLIPGLQDLLAKHGLKPEDISFKVTLTDASSDAKIKQAFDRSLPNAQVRGAIVNFEIEIVNASTGQTIGTADSFSRSMTRLIPLPASPSAPLDQWGAFRYREATGAFEFVPATLVQIDGVRYATISSYTNSVYVVAENKASFADAQGHWAQSTIELAAAKGLVEGVGGGAFQPQRDVTRAEFAAMLVRALSRGASPAHEAPYKDVQASAWYADVVARARELGLLDFASGASFKPEQPLTREEMASMLAAAAKLQQLPVSDGSSNLAAYKDIGSANPAYREAIQTVVQLDIMTGTRKDAFDPTGKTTRAQAATVLIRGLRAFGMID